jgi:alkane 1-monooxygenase
MFPAATLGPALLLLLAALWGGAWAVLALVSITFAAFALDLIVARLGAPNDSEFPAATPLTVAIAAAHLLLLATGVAALAGGWLSGLEKLALFAALGLWLGQVSNANAHELIHRADPRLFALGSLVYVSLFFGHHASAHPKIHHRYVATRLDPNTAALGEPFYAFAPRAWGQSFRAGWEIELSQLQRLHGRRAPLWRHPYVKHLAGAAALFALALALGGVAAAAAYLALAAYAQAQLLLSDYVQHYGLERHDLGRGQFEPVGPAHSWNAPHPWSSRMMLHAPRHSDHHAHPQRGYAQLRLPSGREAPRLPASLPVMAMAALVPPLWHRLMDDRARRWHRPAPALQAVAAE